MKDGENPPNHRAADGMVPHPDMNNGGRERRVGNGNAAKVKDGK